ncbi:MAG: hypothetical protein JWP22_2538 [Ramlibacter sp.]|nr:hypothetical protein [Ramlibacter sp.]
MTVPAASSSLSRLRERAGARAKALRQTQTDAEKLLWYRLRDRRLLDLKFRRQRAAEMERLGFRTLRFWDNDVLKETDAVMEKIRQVAETLALTPTLSRKREREQCKQTRNKAP